MYYNVTPRRSIRQRERENEAVGAPPRGETSPSEAAAVGLDRGGKGGDGQRVGKKKTRGGGSLPSLSSPALPLPSPALPPALLPLACEARALACLRARVSHASIPGAGAPPRGHIPSIPGVPAVPRSIVDGRVDACIPSIENMENIARVPSPVKIPTPMPSGVLRVGAECVDSSLKSINVECVSLCDSVETRECDSLNGIFDSYCTFVLTSKRKQLEDKNLESTLSPPIVSAVTSSSSSTSTDELEECVLMSALV